MSYATTFGLVIPGYRNVENLRKCLTSVVTSSTQLAANLVVVDDSGENLLMEALFAEFPGVKWVGHERNLGFGQSVNDGVAACNADVVVLLNDDTQLEVDPVPLLQTAFQDDSVFAVSFRALHADGQFREGAKRLTWRHGLPRILHNPNDQRRPRWGKTYSSYAVGGHAAFRRSMFIALQGMDELFAPFYWEDVDLCQRAARHGWHTVYEERCIVVHAGSSAIRAANDELRIREIILRNRLLFAWRHAPWWLRPYIHWATAFTRAQALVYGDQSFKKAYLDARKRWQSRHRLESSRTPQLHNEE